METETLYGFFSYQALKYGFCIYATPDGKEVEVTGVFTDPEAKSYKWADKKCVGVVTGWLRQGVESKSRKIREKWINFHLTNG